MALPSFCYRPVMPPDTHNGQRPQVVMDPQFYMLLGELKADTAAMVLRLDDIKGDVRELDARVTRLEHLRIKLFALAAGAAAVGGVASEYIGALGSILPK